MDQDPGQIRAEVEDAREDLGETVEALAAKVNAPRRIKDDATARAHAAKEQAAQRIRSAQERLASESDSISPSLRSRVDQGVSIVRRHPTASAAAAIGIVSGIVLGRASK